MRPNIPENRRGRKTPKRGSKRHFDAEIFEERFCTNERVFAWEDKVRRLLLRFERISQVHYALKDACLHDDQSAALPPQLSSLTGRLCFLAAHRAVVMHVCFTPTNSLNDSHPCISRLIIAIHRCSQTLTTMLRPITLETRNQLFTSDH
jgi:hypothetical protein